MLWEFWNGSGLLLIVRARAKEWGPLRTCHTPDYRRHPVGGLATTGTGAKTRTPPETCGRGRPLLDRSRSPGHRSMIGHAPDDRVSLDLSRVVLESSRNS